MIPIRRSSAVSFLPAVPISWALSFMAEIGPDRAAMEKGAPSGPLERVALSLWSTVHGYTTLELAGLTAGSDGDFGTIPRAARRACGPTGP